MLLQTLVLTSKDIVRTAHFAEQANICNLKMSIAVKRLIVDIRLNRKKNPKESPNNKIANVAGSVSLSLFMDGSIKCKLPSPA